MIKKGFGLLSVLILLVVFSFLSINIVQNQTFSSKIDTLKYLHLQAIIYISNVKKYIQNNSDEQIQTYNLDDDRFILLIQSEDINSSTILYHISLKTNDDTHIAVYDSLVK